MKVSHRTTSNYCELLSKKVGILKKPIRGYNSAKTLIWTPCMTDTKKVKKEFFCIQFNLERPKNTVKFIYFIETEGPKVLYAIIFRGDKSCKFDAIIAKKNFGEGSCLSWPRTKYKTFENQTHF